jgi:gluconolactonase
MGDSLADSSRPDRNVTLAAVTRAPEPAEYDVVDERFVDLIVASGELEHLADGCTWAEGPVYVPDERILYWSDVRSNRLMRFDEATGVVSEQERPANFCNGHTLDLDGVVVACEHGTRSVVRWWPGGRRQVVADRFDGKRLNSPNDVVVASDGSVWFTDPTYGIDSNAEGYQAQSEIGSSNVYRVDPATGEVTAQVTDMVRPNGLAFSLDETVLYVADTGVSHVDEGPRHIRTYDVDLAAGGVTGGGAVWATCPQGVFDGFRLDADGRLWASGEQGVHCYLPDATLLGTIRLPEVCANVEFGGPDRRTLYMTANTSLYRLDLDVTGTR